MVTIQEPAVEAHLTSGRALPFGQEVQVRLTRADVSTRSVLFALE